MAVTDSAPGALDRTISVLARSRRVLSRITLLLAFPHLVIAGLYVADRAVPLYPTPFSFIAVVGNSDIWSLVHGGIGMVLLGGVAWLHLGDVPEWTRTDATIARALTWACSASAVLSLVWGLLLAAWALLTPKPVSLLAPALVLMVLSPLAGICRSAWTDRET